MSEEKTWEPDPAVTRRAMGAIDRRQSNYPVCPCGQRTNPGRSTCSKTSEEHRVIVAEWQMRSRL